MRTVLWPDDLTLSVLSQGSSFQMSDLKDPGVYKPLVIGIMLMVFQQMTGINAIMFYAENIFEQAHFKVRRLQTDIYSGEMNRDSQISIQLQLHWFSLVHNLCPALSVCSSLSAVTLLFVSSVLSKVL